MPTLDRIWLVAVAILFSGWMVALSTDTFLAEGISSWFVTVPLILASFSLLGAVASRKGLQGERDRLGDPDEEL